MKTAFVHRLARRNRGQVLALFGAGLFLTALMVMITLAITNRIKERMEVQTLADAAAYSNAVATARAMNGIALTNRAMIGELVAKAGIHALVSYTANYQAQLIGQQTALGRMLLEFFDRCNPGFFQMVRWGVFMGCNCPVSNVLELNVEPRMMAALGWANGQMTTWEPIALAQMQVRNAMELLLFAQQTAIYNNGLMGDKLNDQQLAKRIVAQADFGGRWPGELTAPDKGDFRTRQEISGGFSCVSGGALCWANPLAPFHLAEATMGSIGWPFVNQRFDDSPTGGGSLISLKLRKNWLRFLWEIALPPMEIPPLAGGLWPVLIELVGKGAEADCASGVVGRCEGGTYWALAEHVGWFMPVIPGQLISDDYRMMHYAINPTWMIVTMWALAQVMPAGPGIPGWFAALRAAWVPPPCDFGSGRVSTDDVHMGGPTASVSMLHSFSTMFPGASTHLVIGELGPIGHVPNPLYIGELTPNPFAMPWFFDYNLIHVMEPGDNFGQPKNMSVIQRDYSVRGGSPDPWSLPFFYQQGGGGGQKLELSGEKLVDGTSIALQTGIGTGIAYYHRRGHWKEPPNTLNPYWRATLVAADTDDSGGDDAADLLQRVGRPDAKQALDALRAVGYKGMY